MIIPTEEQIENIRELLKAALTKLIAKDSAIFILEVFEPKHLSNDAKILNRKLHEITINHRLAYYLERCLEEKGVKQYNVDLEYNRFYNNPKLVQTEVGLVEARPNLPYTKSGLIN